MAAYETALSDQTRDGANKILWYSFLDIDLSPRVPERLKTVTLAKFQFALQGRARFKPRCMSGKTLDHVTDHGEPSWLRQRQG